LEVYIINSIAKSYILNIKIRPLMTEYALRIKPFVLPTRLILMCTSVSYTIYIIFLYSNILKENKIDAMLPFEIFFASRL
jgi:hypothetical protein